MQIVWSDEALADYHQNIDYLISRWSVSVAAEFIEDAEAVIELIKTHPQLYPITEYREIRSAVVRGQIALFFKVSEDSISLVRFWNNYQNPEKLKF